MLPLEYFFLSVLVSSAMLGTIFLIVWFSIERKYHTMFWALVFWVSVVNMLLNAGRGYFPDRNVYWVIVNATSLIMFALVLGGYRHRAGLRPFPRAFIGLLLLVEAAIAWFSLVQHHMGIRMALTPYCGAIVTLLCIVALKKKEGPLRPAEWGAVVILAAYTLMQIGYGSVALMQGAERDDYWLSIYSSMNFLAMPVVHSGLGLFTVLIVADDIAVRMRRLATTDQLTKLLNRRGFFDAADRLLEDCRRRGETAFLALVDIDHFKKINDCYGHNAGDRALRQFSQLLSLKMRRNDIPARMGGEEFVILFTAQHMEDAVAIMERLRKDIESMTVTTKEYHFSLTASFGLVAAAPGAVYEALSRADELLYRAKDAGRNRVVYPPIAATIA